MSRSEHPQFSRRTLLDDMREGIATETTYAYERASNPKFSLAVFNNYKLTSLAPTTAGGPCTCTVHRWSCGTGTGAEVGVAEGTTPEQAQDRARALAADDWERRTVDPSSTWWQGVEAAR